MKAHKHAALIKQWADGVEVERCQLNNRWIDDAHPTWHPDVMYRAKPKPAFKPKPGDLVLMSCADRWYSAVFEKMTSSYYEDEQGTRWHRCRPHPLQVERDMLAAKCDELAMQVSRRGARMQIMWEAVDKAWVKMHYADEWKDWFDEEGKAK